MFPVVRSLCTAARWTNDQIAKVDKDPLRKVINIVSLVVLTYFAQRQYENTMWWGFSWLGGLMFRHQIRQGAMKDLSDMSIKFLAPLMFFSTAYYWPVKWKVVSVLTGFAAGVYSVEIGIWCNSYPGGKKPEPKPKPT